MAAVFLRLTSCNCSIIFTSLVGTWTSSGDTMTATWRYSLLGPFLATQSRRPWKRTPFSGIVPLLKYGLPLWLSPSLSAVTSIFLNFLWGGASLALRKFRSVTNSLYFPLKLFPKYSDITYLVTRDWEMNPLRMAGWGSDGCSHPGEGQNKAQLFLGGSTWCLQKGCRIKFSKGYFKSAINPQNEDGWF